MTKLLLLGDPERLRAVHDEVAVRWRHEVTMVQTEGFLLQVMHATASKAAALRAVARELHVDRTRVLAVGDNANDVGMLQWAGCGVAMGNAAEITRRVADATVAGNDDDGVAEAVRRFVFNGDA